jgi:hypothetical protein
VNTTVRNKLDMVTRVRTFSRAHPSTEPTYTTVLGRLEERLTEAQAIATRGCSLTTIGNLQPNVPVGVLCGLPSR